MFFGFFLRVLDIFFNILNYVREKEETEHIDITNEGYDE